MKCPICRKNEADYTNGFLKICQVCLVLFGYNIKEYHPVNEPIIRAAQHLEVMEQIHGTETEAE